MFNWFLKLLGIEEDKPAQSDNSFMEATEAKPAEPKAELKPKPELAAKSLEDEFPGLKANYVKVLEEAGFTTKASIDKASDKDLLALKGIGKATLKIIRA